MGSDFRALYWYNSEPRPSIEVYIRTCMVSKNVNDVR